MKKKVSICIPAYKQVDFLRRCLDSILIQNYTDFEVVVSDDTPTDEIKDLVCRYRNLPIIYCHNEKPLGSPGNWNNAIHLANGEYIKIMHHDDWFAHPFSLRKFVEMLDENPDADFAFSASREIGKDMSKKLSIKNIEKKFLCNNPDILGYGNMIGTPSVTIFRKKKNVFFDNKLVWLVDIDFYIRILRNNKYFISTKEELVCVGNEESRITNKCINDKSLISCENKYVREKLSLKYGFNYPIYHFIRYTIILSIKKKLLRRKYHEKI